MRGIVVCLCLPLFSPAWASDPEVELEPSMRLQVWGTAWDFDEDAQADPASYGDPEADPGFSIRRARLGLGGTYDKVFWHISAGTGAPYDALSPSEPLVTLVDAYAGMTWGEDSTFSLSLGSTQIPFNREMLISSKHLLFQERSVHTAWMSPNRDVGVLGDWAHTSGVQVRGGVYNGNANLLGDDNLGVMGVVRVDYNSGVTDRSFDTSGDNAVGVGVGALINPDVATTTLGLNADALVRVGSLTAILGATRSSITPVADAIAAPDVSADTVQFGFFGQLSAYVPDVGDGGLELGARYASFDDATALSDNGDVGIVHVGGMWRDPLPGFDVGAHYVLRLEHNGRTLPNDTIRLVAQFRYPIDDRS